MEIRKVTENVDIPCPTCKGRGTVMVIAEQDKYVKYAGHREICPRCHGSKIIHATINKIDIED